MNFMTIFNQVLVLFLLIIIGFAASKKKLIDDYGAKQLSTVVLYITLPALIIRSMQFDFSMQLLGESAAMVGISAITYTTLIALSYLLVRLTGAKNREKDVLQASMIFPNVGFMGYPIVFAVFGETGVFYTALFNMLFDLLMWTVGVHILSRSSDITDETSHLRKALLNPGTLAVITGFSLFVFGIKLPQAADRTLEYLAGATTPIAMVTVGAILSRTNIKSIFTNKGLLITAALKMIVLPLLVVGALNLSGLTGYFRSIPAIIIAMPVAANVAILSARYDSDYSLASQSVFLTTLISLITIPLVVMLVS